MMWRLFRFIKLTVASLTLNWRAITACESVPNERSWRISPASIRDSFLIGETIRPFFAQSFMLSVLVPRNKWSGLTQDGTSHVWQTCSPVGIGPLKYLYANRWAGSCPVSSLKAPYPQRAVPAVHSQQPDSVTGIYFSINRSMYEAYFGMGKL